MKRILLIVILTYITISPIYAIVDFSGYFAIPYDDGPACLGNQYFEVGFHTNFELNNDQFQIQRSTDPNFSWAITSTSGFNGNIDGCGREDKKEK